MVMDRFELRCELQAGDLTIMAQLPPSACLPPPGVLDPASEHEQLLELTEAEDAEPLQGVYSEVLGPSKVGVWVDVWLLARISRRVEEV